MKTLPYTWYRVTSYAADMSHRMGKPTICIGENKGADQLRSNREADQRLCFRYMDSTIPLLFQRLIIFCVQSSLCRTWSEPKLLVLTHRLIWIFKPLSIFCGHADRFLSDLAPRSENIMTKTCPCNVYPFDLHLYSKIGAQRGIPVFLIFSPKHRLWALVRAVLTCTHELCFE